MKIDRLVSIIMILLEKERIGAKELADMFEVSPRTIYRDVDAINMAGIPVRSVPGVGGGFEIMPNYKLEKKVFSTSDLSAILMGLSGMSNMIRGEELVNAVAKVKSFIPAEQAEDVLLKANQIYIDLNPWMGNRNIEPCLETIQTAITKRRLLSFSYIDHRGVETERTAEPYQLILKNSHWYWQGFCYKRNDFRLFKLSRMSGLKMKDTCFTPRDYKGPQLDFKDEIVPIQIEITIRIHRSVMDQVLDYCTYDRFTPDGSEYFIIRFPFIENDYNYNMLLSLGDKCECLAPPHVRDKIQKKIQCIAALYQ